MTCWANIDKLLRSLQQKPIKCNSHAFFLPIISSFHTKIVPLHSQTSSKLFAILIKLNENHFSTGEVLEWLKRHAWKACKRLKRFGGSNPPLSAITLDYQRFMHLMDDFTHTLAESSIFRILTTSTTRLANVQKKASNSKVGAFFGTSWTRFGRIRKPFSRSHEKSKPRLSIHEQRGVSLYFLRFSA